MLNFSAPNSIINTLCFSNCIITEDTRTIAMNSIAKIAELKAILADEKLLLGVIRTEIKQISDKFGDDRKSKIGFDAYDISMEDMIPNEDENHH